MQAQASRPATSVAKPRVRRGYNPHIFYVDSRSQPGTIHMVLTNHGGHCTCPGYRHRGRCAHIDFCQDHERHIALVALMAKGGAA
jgi:hypothetical protein